MVKDPFQFTTWKSSRRLQCVESSTPSIKVGKSYTVFDGWDEDNHIWWLSKYGRKFFANLSKSGNILSTEDGSAKFILEE